MMISTSGNIWLTSIQPSATFESAALPRQRVRRGQRERHRDDRVAVATLKLCQRACSSPFSVNATR